MKIIIITILFLSSILAFANTTPPADWLNSSFAYKSKISTIKKDKIPIILYVYASWCPYCKKLNTELRNKEIREYLKGFTKIAVDGGLRHVDKTTDNIKNKYKITGFPTLLLIYPNKKYKKFYIPVELSDSKFLKALKRKIGQKAYKMSKKGIKNSGLKKKEIADLYSNNGKTPKIIEISDKEGENSGMRAYKVITENPQAKFYNNTGDIYFKKGKYKKAKNEYFESLKYDKKNQRSYYNLARCYYILSRKQKDNFKRLKFLKKANIYVDIAINYSGLYLQQ